MTTQYDHQIGDLVFCNSKGFIGFLIRVGQWIKWRDWYQHNHTAVLDSWDENKQDWRVIQARSKGVTRGDYLSKIAPGGTYEIVKFPTGASLPDFMFYLRGQVGDKYGFLTDVCIGVNILTPKVIKIDVRRDGTWICSGVISAGLMFAGWDPMVDASDIYQISPAELYGMIQKSRKGK